MKAIGYGLDLSHHQHPSKVPWDRFPGAVDFCICRAGYGSGLRDRHVVEHVRRARETGTKVGLYLFYRPSQPVEEQWELLRSVADSVRIGEGDIVPALDIELDPLPKKTPVDPSWEPFCRTLVERMVECWGDALVYITQREWGMLGKPAWVLERPLWIAHYTAAAAPASPGKAAPVIWQHRVGPFNPNGPGGYDSDHPEYDQNRLLAPLPLIGGAERELSDSERERIMGLVALTSAETLADDDAPERSRFA